MNDSPFISFELISTPVKSVVSHFAQDPLFLTRELPFTSACDSGVLLEPLYGCHWFRGIDWREVVISASQARETSLRLPSLHSALRKRDAHILTRVISRPRIF